MFCRSLPYFYTLERVLKIVILNPPDTMILEVFGTLFTFTILL